MKIARAATAGALLGLFALCLAWELFLAPLRPGGSWLVLKALPLLLPLPGILAGRPRAYAWALLLLAPFYLAEGAVRAWSDHGWSAGLALLEALLAATFAATSVAFLRIRAKSVCNQPAIEVPAAAGRLRL